MSFAGIFDFRRPTAARYRAANGKSAMAAIDQPRFDHAPDGARLGLLVEAGAEMGQHDRVRLKDVMAAGSAATVLHEIAAADGTVTRRAHYSLNPAATVNACLAQVGHHRAIGVAPGFIRIRSGFVACRGKRWAPPAVIVQADGTPIALAAGLLLLAR